jgi:hypothetical protein
MIGALSSLESSALLARVEQVFGLRDELRGEIVQAFLVELAGHVVGGAAIVHVVDAGQDRAARRQDRIDRKPGIDEAQVVDRVGQQRVGHGDLDAPVVLADWQDAVGLRERDRNSRRELGIDLLGL